MSPDTLIAELTYRCPLACAYCSNPISYNADTLTTQEWIAAFDEAERLGVLQLHLTGGEPLLRDDLEALVAAARERDLYVNLITSGVPLSKKRLGALVAAGVDHVQLSIQGATAQSCDAIAGAEVFWHKLAVAGWVKELGVSLTINVVLHRANIAEVPELMALAELLGADRLELANTQYLGWALQHREALLPDKSDVDRARAAAAGRKDIVFVLPDYFTGRPRACMSGWGRRYLVIAPDGKVLPCQAAHGIAGLAWERVGERPLAEIWRNSPSLVRYRGQDWMPEPCRSCDERFRDHGGCRCQAFQLTGDAGATDPACDKSPHHGTIKAPAVAALPYRRLRLI